MRLAENLKILRRNEDISQEEISERFNVSRQTISKWENGQSQPSIEMLIDLANWFEVSIDDLVRGDMTKNKKVTYTNSDIPVAQGDFLHVSDEKVDDEVDVVCPRIGLEGLHSYLSFKAAYEKDLELHRTGDKSLLSDIMNHYTDAFDQGIMEAAVNMLRILTHTSMNCKIKEPDKEFPLQERVDFYINRLEEADHPAGAFYRAIHLIYRLVKNEKTDDENWDDGLILMYQLAEEGNEFAIDYVEYLESAEDDESEE
jgi:transcriptional regulator with XRE-family HTH domain